MQIAVIGLGGVGGYFGFKLAHFYKNCEDVTISFIARNPTYEIIRKNGLRIESPEYPEKKSVHPDLLLEHINDLKSIDVVLVCVKEFDLVNVCLQLKPIIKDHTVILPLMNGVDIYDRIRSVIGNGVVLPSCVYVASHLRERGEIVHQGKQGSIIVGNDPISPFIPDSIIALFSKAGISIAYQEDVFTAIWEKFIFIASFGLVSGRYNRSIGQILDSKDLKRKANFIMEEIRNIAIHRGIPLPLNIIDQTFKKAEQFPYLSPTSLQLDIQSGKPKNELELFAAPILKYGPEMNLPVENTKKIYSEIIQFLTG